MDEDFKVGSVMTVEECQALFFCYVHVFWFVCTVDSMHWKIKVKSGGKMGNLVMIGVVYFIFSS